VSRTPLLGLVGVAALALPGVARATTVDRTVSCPVATISGIPSIAFGAGVKQGSAAWSIELKPDTGQPMQLIGAYGGRPGGVTVGLTCRKAAKVTIARGALPRFSILDAANNVIEEHCTTGSHVVVRLRANLSHGSAVSGDMIMRTGKKLRAVMYVTWTPFSMSIYQTGDCNY